MPRRIQNVLLFYFVPLIAWWRSAKCNGHRMPFRGSASVPNIHHSPISARTLTYYPKKHFFGRASWQANIRWPAKPETRWPNMAALLWVFSPPPAPKGSATPIVRSRIQNYRTELIVCSFESYWQEKQLCDIDNTLFQIFRKIQTKNKMAVAGILFSCIVSKVYKTDHFGTFEALEYLCFGESFRMSMRWAL